MNKTSVIIVCLSAAVLAGYILAFTSGGKDEISKIEDELKTLRKKAKKMESGASAELRKSVQRLENDFEKLKARI